MALPDKDSLSASFGGPYTNARPVEDASTEVGAEGLNPALCDVAMMTHTAIRAWVSFLGVTISGGPPDAITVADHDALWGSGTGVKPTVSHTTTGRYIITWATTQDDELGDSHTLLIRKPRAWVTGVSDRSDARVVSYTANTITIDCFNDAGALNALNGFSIWVEWA